MKHKITAPLVINHSGRKIFPTRKVRGLKYLWLVQKMKCRGCEAGAETKFGPGGSNLLAGETHGKVEILTELGSKLTKNY